jgi:predicted PurR-regulated permease PerM
MNSTAPNYRFDVAAWITAAAALFLILLLHLLPALLAGLLVHQLIDLLSSRLVFSRFRPRRRKWLAVLTIAVAVIAVVTVALIGLAALLNVEGGPLALIYRIADILDRSRELLPPWLVTLLPTDMPHIKLTLETWLREHAGYLGTVGLHVGRGLAHIVIGMIIGALIAMHQALDGDATAPLARALAQRVAKISLAFRRVVFAQIRISALNTTFTGLYILAVLPLAGVHLPFAKSLVVLTFIVGLLPVIGNLISNTAIVVVSLGVSPQVALASLAFLVIIHKLEYFLNARIVGGRINARAWEMLLAMMALEAAFGLSGLVAAPVYYAYLKDELSSQHLI